MTETILVTGGAGFIGSHVCKALNASGFRPLVFDDLSNGHRETVKWGHLEVGDLCDADRLRSLFEAWRPTAVIHLAGFIAAGESVADPAKYYGNNLRSTLTLLDTMLACDVRRIVFSSSAAVYGAPESIPIKETAALGPTNPYGHTKLMTEQMLRDYVVYGLSSVSLRYFNAAGADPDGEIGEMHEPETHLIPLLLEAAAGTRPNIDIFGDRHPTPDGTCIRDYVHVSDLAAAHVLALNQNDVTSAARAYNLGNGNGFSVAEVVASVERVTGQRIPVRIKDRRAGDPPTLVANSDLAKRELGWTPQYENLATQIRHAWQWHQQNTLYRDGPTRLTAT